ncbi:tRNA (adenosine(37)-N6)-threonylcarbamoyltransferase complex dimerization subunit type 1 TsaB [Staphylococcus sp. SQ8-PEA]|uniref:tRNA (Adenosine(37)-N6)-threonylcarbamoyltransferase complex dimerization subunit type 1 TsaB n=1 Tax=Staphylococcus marylandisciuri TaxID=2981529 RepID=A0ABT2QQA0_9STAP|nr:tRNA (adenosine(37)-N6)-threonylcarbamoyltransferase complex dimerization subunit type 1 TsaB [Staphylococcus marylandisciuri]MCU5746149.1 tRNA (adenosine(37)-N6)-threonylcarbamoyltransferase complex dimerization subunit type 1 TsaB [Staphylococcus marylandisciuri]
MNYLLIDTSNQPLSVALMQDDEVLAEVNNDKKVNHSVQLMPAVQKVIERSHVEKRAIDRIVVAEGPGSYTGLRIGVTVAKTLAYSVNAELYGVSSLKALAATVKNIDKQLLVPIFDARREAVYAGVFKKQGDTLEVVFEEQYITINDLNRYLNNLDEEFLFVGIDAVKLKDFLNGEVLEMLPKASSMRTLIAESADIKTFTPNYLKLSEAERNWNNQHSKR